MEEGLLYAMEFLLRISFLRVESLLLAGVLYGGKISRSLLRNMEALAMLSNLLDFPSDIGYMP